MWKAVVTHGRGQLLGRTHQLRNYVSRPVAAQINPVTKFSGTGRFVSKKNETLGSAEEATRSNRSISLSQPSPAETSSKPDTAATIFLKNSQTTINVNPTSSNEDASIFIAKTGDVVHFHLDAQRREDDTKIKLDDSSPSKNIQSIEDRMWRKQTLDLQKLPSYYLLLSKSRLTALVVLTTMAGYGIAPGVFNPAAFFFCTVGTAMTSAAANAVNQFYEVPFDAQMNRTKNRVLVKGLISPLHAVGFATFSGIMGLSILMWGVNIVTASLGAFNLYFYTMVYTPMKRMSMVNTWIGSVVGAIPPMMGWAASTGGVEPGAWLLAALMYAWQFPHFNALSWNLRSDYSRGGYRMVAVVDPAMCKRVAFRYCIGLIGLCTLAPVLDVTTWTFAIDSLPLNLYFSYLGWRFYRDGDSNSSRKLFRFSLIHLPALFMLMLISKKNFGEKAKKSVTDDSTSTVQSVT
ncbi:hypothetical protein ScPMuIL_004258 [Solemya velum]